MITGLTLGKFAPLHKGHQYMIETALREVDRLYVLIYETDIISVPLNIRAGWIKKLYPQVIVLEGWDGPDGYSDDTENCRIQEEYILYRLGGIKIHRFYSSEFYGHHVSQVLDAEDRRVDEARRAVPVSATLIRQNPYLYRHFISPEVYPDLITKIVFMGAPSTGKTTLAEALAKKYHTQWVSEYGRTYWEENHIQRRLRLEEFDNIIRGHIQSEEKALLQADQYLFVDTNAITTYMFCQDYHNQVTPLLAQTALESQSRYDLYFLCEDDIPYDDTWDRSGDQKRKIFHKKIKGDLLKRKLPYISLRGDIQTRIKTVESILAEFKTHSNFYGNRNRE